VTACGAVAGGVPTRYLAIGAEGSESVITITRQGSTPKPLVRLQSATPGIGRPVWVRSTCVRSTKCSPNLTVRTRFVEFTVSAAPFRHARRPTCPRFVEFTPQTAGQRLAGRSDLGMAQHIAQVFGSCQCRWRMHASGLPAEPFDGPGDR